MMQNPRLSFSAATMIWLILMLIISKQIFEKSTNSQTLVGIDLIMTEKVSKAQKPAKKNFQNLQKKHKPDLKSEEGQSSEELLNLSSNKNEKKIVPLYRPLPVIPDELRYEAFNSYAIASFHIAPDGSVAMVELIKPCADPRLNHLLLKSLKDWKFSAASDGKAFRQDIRVSFRVE